jgi:hypothetical protein
MEVYMLIKVLSIFLENIMGQLNKWSSIVQVLEIFWILELKVVVHIFIETGFQQILKIL